MKHSVLLFLSVIFMFKISLSQDIQFRYTNIIGDKQEIIFTIIGIQDDIQANKIIGDFEKYDKIISCKIFYNKRCKITINKQDKEVSADKFRQILIQNNADFDIDYLKVLNKKVYSDLANKKTLYIDPYKAQPIPAEKWVYPNNFPKFQDTGNPALDKENFAIAKQNWIEENPEAYKTMTGVEYLDYSILLNHK